MYYAVIMQKSDETNGSITISLDALQSTETVQEKQLIYGELFNYLKDNIISTAKGNIALCRDKEKQCILQDEIEPLKYTPCFFINGGRGSGKSTLLRALKEALLPSKDREDKNDSRPRIELLAEIDPTELADGESFFIHVLSMVCEILNKYPRTTGSYSDHTDELRNQATKCIQDMSHGLKLLSDKESLAHVSDAAFFISESVEECASSAQLKKRFNELLRHLCHITGNDAFLITVDDADMNFNKCSEVLETVRKYMQSPRIIFLFAGDLQLYSLVARGMQLKHFGDLALKYDDDRKTHRNVLLGQLEDQYLMKLFPATNRINLRNFAELLLKEASVELKFKNQEGANTEDTISLQTFLGRHLKYIVPQQYAPVIRALFSTLPMRSMLQLLQYWQKNIRWDEGKVVGESKTNHFTHPSEIANGIRMIAIHALIKHQIDFTAIHKGSFDELLRVIITHIAHTGMTRESYKLLPTIGEDTQRLVSLYLSTEALWYLQEPSTQLSYICRVFPHLLKAREMVEQEETDEMTIHFIRKKYHEAVAEQLYYTAGDDTRRHGVRATAFLIPHTKSGSNTGKRFGRGVIRLMKKKVSIPVSKAPKERSSIQSYVGELTKLITPENKNYILYYLAIYNSLCKIYDKRESSYYLSVYNLISRITELLKLKDSKRFFSPDGQADESARLERLEAIRKIIFPNNGNLPTITKDDVFEKDAEPSTSKSTTNEAAASTGEQEEEEQDEIYKNFAECIQKDAETEAVRQALDDIDSWLVASVQKPKDAIQNNAGQGSNKEGKREDILLTYPVDLASCWYRFYTQCETATDNARLSTSSATNTLVEAGSLFASYLRAFLDATKAVLRDPHLSETIGNFPLWRILTLTNTDQDFESVSKLYTLTNAINVGALGMMKKKKNKNSTPASKTPQQNAAQQA